jgi:hypothetical protein
MKTRTVHSILPLLLGTSRRYATGNTSDATNFKCKTPREETHHGRDGDDD